MADHGARSRCTVVNRSFGMSKLMRDPSEVRALAEDHALRYQIATREPLSSGETVDLQIATMWGAKGTTAEHVYLLGACDEAIPGARREDYPGE